MKLESIYYPVKNELIEVEKILKNSLKNTKYTSILKINNYLLNVKGKRLRPALVLLSAKASLSKLSSKNELINIASALELVHMASLVHDDVIDKSNLRHHRPTINFKKGEDVAIVLGDYLYSVAFELLSNSGSLDIIRCISSATKTMCEGEFLQVCERDNFDLSREKYILFVKKKTASLFAASCQAGALFANSSQLLNSAMKEYGINFGIAFQIIDDYLDLVSDKKIIGKIPGQDIKVGEITLPVLNLLESLPLDKREEFKILLNLKKYEESLQKMRLALNNTRTLVKTKETAFSFINLAKGKIEVLSNSAYKESLLSLVDYIVEKGFNGKS